MPESQTFVCHLQYCLSLKVSLVNFPGNSRVHCIRQGLQYCTVDSYIED